VRVPLNDASVRRKLELRLDVVTEQPAKQPAHMADEVVEIERVEHEHLTPAERQQLPRERRRALAGVADLIEIGSAGLVEAVVPGEHVAKAENGGELVVEIVGDAAGEPADRFHLQGLLKLPFRIAALGDIESHADDAIRLTIGVADQPAVSLRPTPG